MKHIFFRGIKFISLISHVICLILIHYICSDTYFPFEGLTSHKSVTVENQKHVCMKFFFHQKDIVNRILH
jgi:hypothetical protein